MFLSLALCWTCPLLEKAVSPVLFLFSQLAYPKPSDEGIAASVLITISRPFLQKPHLTWSACCEITVHLPNLPCCILSSRLFSKGHCLPLSISLLTDFHHADIYPTLNSQFLDSFPCLQLSCPHPTSATHSNEHKILYLCNSFPNLNFKNCILQPPASSSPIHIL